MQTTTIDKKGTLELPSEIRKDWQGSKVFVFPGESSIVVKKIYESPVSLSEIPSRTKGLKRMTMDEINKEIEDYRNGN